ncbi:YbjQ family protein [Peptoniphilus indolicus]|uniref:UPF0145 protein HMPREF9129_0993 n=2 Tax=Peptoniphilus indolicus TaxID=33030 RepID=G4D3L3_9FIRM|nr:YbjQ family protein [Peptoniphilus indolicus]EGY79888.1 DNA mismatch repair protein MutS [Peptoniphilus indolicus ATCC 29427]SUB75690.1 Domain of uncharacterised function (DUF74) [Peptoniphilus indolicus]
MIITTTDKIEGKEIVEYLGVVFGETVNGINFVKDFGAGIRNLVGGRSAGYEEELVSSREDAIAEMTSRATKIGADAIVGLKMNVEAFGQGNMLLVNVIGTAVKLK